MQKNPNQLTTFLLVVTFLILLMAGFILTILFLYRKKQLVYQQELEKIKSDYEKILLKTQLEIQEETFQSISRDIHDNINLSLTLAKLNLNTINPIEIEKSLDQIKTSLDFISKAITDLSDISRSMNSDIIKEHGLISALQLEIDKMRKLKLFGITLDISGNPVYMDGQKEVFVFRIIQEAFNNIVKHAQAKEIWLHLHYNFKSLIINIQDDGIGFLTTISNIERKTTPPSAGLRNMQSRAELLNGTFDLQSSPSKGTKIKITIPLV